MGVALLAAAGLIAASCGGDDDSESSVSEVSTTIGEDASGSDADDTADSADDGGSDQESDSATEDDTAESVDEGGSDQESTDAGASGTLRYGQYTALTNLDPDLANVGPDATWLYPAYDRLVHLAPDGSYIPGLAEEWTISPDGLEITLVLRDGVLFHDGSSLDADVVVANLERSISLEGSANASSLTAITSVEAVDDLTVRLNLSQPAASLIGVMSDKPGIMISGQALADGVDLSQEAVGAGMFRLDSYRAGDRAVFTRFEDYWDPGSVLVEQLELVELLDDNARLNALRDGQVDAARIAADAVSIVESEGFEVQRTGTLEVWYIPLRMVEGEPLADPTVREALTYALDRQGLLDALYQGAGTVASQLFPKSYYAASPDIPDDSRPFDVDRAQALLAEAGYPDGFDTTIGLTPGLPPALATAIQASWSAIGVDVTTEPQESSELVENWFAGEIDVFIGAWTGRPDPAITINFLFSKDSTFINAAGYDVPRINELLAEIEASSGDERIELIREVNVVVDEEVFHIPLFALDYIAATAPNVSGLEVYTTVKQEFRGVTVGE